MTELMHTLLKRQLKRYFGDPFSIPQEWQKFFDAVNKLASLGFADGVLTPPLTKGLRSVTPPWTPTTQGSRSRDCGV